ncbi:MAG TPA: hypothetical protein DCE56_02410 [Cyanobacteria bacterium UBA8553]|nr:hypothetical protein [Cyanobacteria bacterium UBA8553]
MVAPRPLIKFLENLQIPFLGLFTASAVASAGCAVASTADLVDPVVAQRAATVGIISGVTVITISHISYKDSCDRLEQLHVDSLTEIAGFREANQPRTQPRTRAEIQPIYQFPDDWHNRVAARGAHGGNPQDRTRSPIPDFSTPPPDNRPQAQANALPSACVGCQYYHGRSYLAHWGEGSEADQVRQLLVCGIHPFGPDGDSCPDWDGEPPGVFRIIRLQGMGDGCLYFVRIKDGQSVEEMLRNSVEIDLSSTEGMEAVELLMERYSVRSINALPGREYKYFSTDTQEAYQALLNSCQ